MNEKMYVYDNTISARTYISYIAEQAGGFALIGRDGKLYIRTIGESSAELPLKYFQDYKWGEKFKVSRIRYEDGIQVFEKGDETNNTVYINQENMYISKQEQIDSIYDNLNNIEVYSFEGNSIIDPALDIGDIVIIDGKKVLYQGSSQYGGKFKANISSKIQGKAKEVTTVIVPSQKTINRRVESRINEAEGNITQLVEETSEYSQQLTEHEQTLNSISQKVESIKEFSREASSMQHLTDTADGENLVLNLTIYGDTEKFKVLTPEEDLVPSEDLVPYGDTIDLIVDTQPRSNLSANAKIFEIAMKEPLRNIGQVRDELNIINNKVTVIRRISNDLQVLEQEIIEELGEIKIPTYKDNTYIYIREYPTLEYFGRYIIDNDYLETFATQGELQQATVQLNSKIEQTSQSILLEVSEEYVEQKKVISAILVSPEKVQIEGNRINLKGTVTANNNFKILDDGSMEARNGKFTGGDIKLIQGNNKENPCFSITMKDDNQRCDLLPNYLAMYDDYSQGLAGAYLEMWISKYGGEIALFNSLSQYTIVRSGQIETTGEMIAEAFNPRSTVEIKENIKKFNNNALNIINNSNIYSFNYKNNKKNNTIGLIIGEGYNTPKEVISNNEAINMYSMNSLAWKAIQELSEKVTDLEKQIKELKK